MNVIDADDGVDEPPTIEIAPDVVEDAVHRTAVVTSPLMSVRSEYAPAPAVPQYVLDVEVPRGFENRFRRSSFGVTFVNVAIREGTPA